jgi:hypothetical protein
MLLSIFAISARLPRCARDTLVPALELTGDLRHRKLRLLTIQIGDLDQKLAGLRPFQGHNVLPIPGDMNNTIFRFSICENIIVKAVALIYLAHATT